jgi:hypothetical protein
MEANKEKSLDTMASEFLSKNEEIALALNLFRITTEQYRAALEPLQRPEFFVTNSANDAA